MGLRVIDGPLGLPFFYGEELAPEPNNKCQLCKQSIGYSRKRLCKVCKRKERRMQRNQVKR